VYRVRQLYHIVPKLHCLHTFLLWFWKVRLGKEIEVVGGVCFAFLVSAGTVENEVDRRIPSSLLL
jgi:hypothetical protein